MLENDNIRRRTACDRCHSQKLRCPRQPGEETCDRCVKAHANCIYSPFRQKPTQVKRSHVTTESPSEGTQNVNASLDHGDSTGDKRRRTSLDGGIEGLEPGGIIMPADIFQSVPVPPSYPDTNLQKPNHMNIDWISHRSFHGIQSNADGANSNLSYIGGSLPQDQLAGISSDEISNSFENEEFHNATNNDYLFATTENTGFEMNNAGQSRAPTPAIFPDMFPELDFNFSPTPRQIGFREGTQPPEAEHLSPQMQSSMENQCIHKLSKLSVDLYEHKMTVPPPSIYYGAMPLDAWAPYATYSIDTTFCLTQCLIDLYPECTSAFVRPRATEITEPIGDGTNTRNPSGAARPARIDHSSILLVLSCHMRLMDIYDEIFNHMKTCIDHQGKLKPGMNKEASFYTPAFQMGKYKPPKITAVLLLVHLMEQLSELATDLWTEIRQAQQPEEVDVTIDTDCFTLSLTTAETAKERANNMVTLLANYKAMMNMKDLAAEG